MTTQEAIEILTAEIARVSKSENDFDLWEALEVAVESLKKQEQ